ncbi:hypothetical protein HYG79_01105 [Costertonia aggregata]|uniref:Uncharacterized protein n=2 Tax=Costertonia aggregata TaxID=343403 RepID=A0A7H9AVY7_9FLAO|nr:hypothetical protein HYG79_01105 [Costertonia aggregata]
MKYTLILLSALVLFGSCEQEFKKKVTDKKDYDKFLDTEPIQTTSKNFELWNSKIRQDSMQLTSFGVVAGEYHRYFEGSGDIAYLKMAEQALKRAVDIAAIGRSGYYRALARNYISQHRFKEALEWANAARAIGSGKKGSQNLLFDVHMELGNYTKAQKYLDSTKNMSDFDYLIRLAKWNDHKGDLDTTIKLMEKATKIAENSKNESLLLWSYTNLGDYYGHAGRINDSYRHYLKALGLDAKNGYAKKGIAWIVFSHEKNPIEALRIMNAVTKTHKTPDYYLLKSEIAAYMNNDTERLFNLDMYYKLVDDARYGSMYNMYNISLLLDDTRLYTKALELSRKEVNNRSTPEAYSYLAYSYFKNGNIKDAKKIVDEHIAGQTFEPGILLQIAQIYKASGEKSKVQEIKKELQGAVYELGPSSKEIIRIL